MTLAKFADRLIHLGHQPCALGLIHGFTDGTSQTQHLELFQKTVYRIELFGLDFGEALCDLGQEGRRWTVGIMHGTSVPQRQGKFKTYVDTNLADRVKNSRFPPF